MHAFAGRATGTAAEHFDLVGDDEGRIETHTELADQVRILLLVAGEIFQEVGSAGLGDGAQVRDDFLAAHTDTVVFEGDGLGILVERQADLQFGATFEQLRLGQRFETQLVSGV